MAARYPRATVVSPRSPMKISSHGAQLIADAAHRDKALGLRWVTLDLAAHVADVNVDIAGVANERALPQMAHDLLAREHALRVRREQRYEPELGGGQLN